MPSATAPKPTAAPAPAAITVVVLVAETLTPRKSSLLATLLRSPMTALDSTPSRSIVGPAVFSFGRSVCSEAREVSRSRSVMIVEGSDDSAFAREVASAIVLASMTRTK